MVQTVSETKELLKRKEVKTMKKDLARLREREAQKEKQKIIKLKPHGLVKLSGVKTKEEKAEKELQDKAKELKEKEHISQRIKEQQKDKFLTQRKETAYEIEKRWQEKTAQQAQERSLRKKTELQRRQDLEKEENILLQEKENLTIMLQTFPEKKAPFKSANALLLKKKQETEKNIIPISEREEKISRQKKLIEIEEKKAGTEKERREAEEQRWQTEEKRKAIEKEKWIQEEKIFRIEDKIKKVNLDYQKILAKEKYFKDKQRALLKRLTAISQERIKFDIEKQLIALFEEQKDTEAQKQRLSFNKEKAQKALSITLKKELETEQELKAFEEEEGFTQAKEQRQSIERQRQEIEAERRQIEKKRWLQEQERDNLEAKIKRVNIRAKKLSGQIEELKDKIKEIEEFVQTCPGPKQETIKIEEQKSAEKDEEKTTEPEKFRPLEKELQTRQTFSPELKKDLSRIKAEQDVKKDFDKKLERAKPEKPAAAEKKAPVLPKLKPLSFKQKIFVRSAIIFALLLVFANLLLFWYWYKKIRQPLAPEPASQEEEQQPASEPEEPEIPEPTFPSPLLPIEKQRILEITDSKDLAGVLSKTLADQPESDGFAQILIKNTAENTFLGLSEFFQAFEINPPQGLLEKLKNNFTLFIYSNQGRNRLGLAAEIKEQEKITGILEYWEPAMEKDLEKLFRAMDKQGPAASLFFRSAASAGTTFRYLSFEEQDFGICWAVKEQYLIFTFSGQSMIKTIEVITNLPE